MFKLMVYEIFNLEILHCSIYRLNLESDSEILESAFGSLLHSTELKSM